MILAPFHLPNFPTTPLSKKKKKKSIGVRAVSYTHLDVYKRQDRDFIKNTNADLIYDKIIMWGNHIYYYFGTMEKINSYGYKTKNNHTWSINDIENCYVKPRLNFDDGG